MVTMIGFGVDRYFTSIMVTLTLALKVKAQSL